MSSFKRIAPRLTGLLFATAAITACGQIGIFLAMGLIFLLFCLVAVLAVTGTFGSYGRQQAAQAVLAILLGRNRPREGDPPQSNPMARARTTHSGTAWRGRLGRRQ
jgi:hypothetical protein